MSITYNFFFNSKNTIWIFYSTYFFYDSRIRKYLPLFCFFLMRHDKYKYPLGMAEKQQKKCIMVSFVWFYIFQMMYILLHLCTSKFHFQVTYSVHSVQSFSRVRLFATPWTTSCQACLSITNPWSLPKLMSVESVMPSNHLIICCPLLLLPSIFPSLRVFSNESALGLPW